MFQVGDKIDDQFLVLERYEGGMGVVLVVVDQITQHKFAVKTLRPELMDDPAALDRFRAEARTWLSIGRHPHLVYAAIYREANGVPLLFLEYVDGTSLADLLREERVLWLPQSLDYALQVCDGMEYLHATVTPQGEQGIIHRDLKPGNVLINRRGEAKVTDFGLAKIHGDIAALAERRRGLGTFSYMPPEQVLDAASADRRSDIYSFGAMLYHMLTGRPPVEGGTTSAVISSILHKAPPPVRQVNSLVPDELAEAVMRCLAKRREERFASFAEVREALEAAREPVAAAVEGRPEWRCRQCGYRTGRPRESCPVCAGPMASREQLQAEEQPAQGTEETPDQAAERLLARALEHRKAGRLDQALLLLRQAAALAPERSDISRALDETALAAARQKTKAAKRSYNWPMEGGNPTRCGYTPEAVAPPLKLEWAAEVAEWTAAPAVVSNGVVIAGGYIDEPGRRGCLRAFRLTDGAILWELRAAKEFIAAPCVVGGKTVYVPVGTRLVAVDPASGRPRWEVDLAAEIYGSPVVLDNLVLVPTEAGHLHALAAATGQTIWRYDADGPLMAGAAAHENLVWVGSTGGVLHAIDVSSGRSVWTYTTGGEIQAPPCLLRDSLYVASLDHRLHCLDAFGGRKRWEFEADGEIFTSPSGWQNTVVIGTRGRCVFGVAADTGKRKWRFAAEDWVDSSAAIAGRTVYFGSHDGHLYALERESGLLLWRAPVGCELTTSPAVSAGRVVITGRDGKVYCFRTRA